MLTFYSENRAGAESNRVNPNLTLLGSETTHVLYVAPGLAWREGTTLSGLVLVMARILSEMSSATGRVPSIVYTSRGIIGTTYWNQREAGAKERFFIASRASLALFDIVIPYPEVTLNTDVKLVLLILALLHGIRRISEARRSRRRLFSLRRRKIR